MARLQDYIYSLSGWRAAVREQHIRQWGFSLFQWHSVAEKFLKSTRYEGLILPLCWALLGSAGLWEPNAGFSVLSADRTCECTWMGRGWVGGNKHCADGREYIYLLSLPSWWLMLSFRAEKILSLSLLTSFRLKVHPVGRAQEQLKLSLRNSLWVLSVVKSSLLSCKLGSYSNSSSSFSFFE